MHKHYSHRVLLVTAAATVLLALVFMTKIGRQDHFHILQFGKSVIKTEIVSTQESRTQGLSGKMFLPENHGMLFVFDRPQISKFWMKDMQFAIDIIWLSAEGQIIAIEKEVTPQTYPSVFGPDIPSMYVLEVNAGVTAVSEVEVGDYVEINQKLINKL